MIQRTLVLVKPDGLKRGLIGKVISRFEDAGLKIVGMKMYLVDEKFAEKHYYDIKERHSERIFKNLSDYIREGPVIAMVIEGVNAIEIVRKLVGGTYPNEALPGTIRGDYAHISKIYANKENKKVGNLIHASADKKDAKREIGLWFSDSELYEYKISHEDEVI